MSDDIVDRLRNGAYADLFMQCAKGEVESCIRCDAAAEIERLREQMESTAHEAHKTTDAYLELRRLITEWADADDDPNEIDGSYHAAWLALRKAVGR